MVPAPAILPENTDLAFLGEAAWPAAALTDRQARQFIAATNRCGRPNSDVLRRRVGVVDGEATVNWQVDFPAHFTLQEAKLYEAPFDFLRRHTADWRNPHAKPALRRALARVTRCLAMPVDAAVPDWLWIEEELVPDASLVVVARDDDFTRGIMSSHAFAAWHGVHRAVLAPDRLIEAFPFPWPPATGLSGLSAAQEDARHAVARAIRTGDQASLDDAVSRAYGGTPESDLLAQLGELNRLRAG